MTEPSQHVPVRPWHRALVYAVAGERHDLADVVALDVDQVAHWLRRELGVEALSRQVEQRRADEHPWPYPVPVDLMRGLGYAQFSAALAQLVRDLDLEPTRSGEVAAEPRLQPAASAALRRLLEDVPPHHGS